MMISRISGYTPARTQSFGKCNKPNDNQDKNKKKIEEQIKMLEEKQATEEAFGNYTDANHYAEEIDKLKKANPDIKQ